MLLNVNQPSKLKKKNYLPTYFFLNIYFDSNYLYLYISVYILVRFTTLSQVIVQLCSNYLGVTNNKKINMYKNSRLEYRTLKHRTLKRITLEY